MKKFVRLFIFFVFSVFISSCTTTIYLVRHAEKLNNTVNSPLNAAGFTRANVLRDSMLNKGIDSIFVSIFLRTQQTAQPTGEAIHEGSVIYSLDSTVQFANHLKNLRGKNVLVVGHTSNIPQIFNIITGDTIQIPESTFNRMFIIKIRKSLTKKISFRKTTYGAT
jgi:phosphohistidine phosphatase SixA